MKIRLEGAELSRADSRTANIAELIVVFRNFAKVFKIVNNRSHSLTNTQFNTKST
jgi:hypothetical protein